MLISHSHQFIYLKTRKTAGTSVEMAFQPWATSGRNLPVEERTHARVSVNGVVGCRLVPPRDRNPLDDIWFNHMPAASVMARVAAPIWGRYVKFAVVRNPFDRMVSYFHWTETLVPEMRGRSEDNAAPQSFDQVRARFRHFVLDTDWADDSDIVMVDGVWCVDAVLRYETLQADMASVARKLGINRAKVLLPTTKSGKHLRGDRVVSDYFDAETIAHVRHRLGWLFDRFDYPPYPSEASDAVGAESLR